MPENCEDSASTTAIGAGRNSAWTVPGLIVIGSGPPDCESALTIRSSCWSKTRGRHLTQQVYGDNGRAIVVSAGAPPMLSKNSSAGQTSLISDAASKFFFVVTAKLQMSQHCSVSWFHVGKCRISADAQQMRRDFFLFLRMFESGDRPCSSRS